MKIGFDAKRALNNASGLGNYSRNLLNALMRDFAEEQYLLFSPAVRDELLNQLQGDFKLLLPETKLQKLLPSLWRSWGIKSDLQKNRLDIYHGLSNEIPFGIQSTGIASVVTIHDLIFLKHTEQYPFVDRQIYKLKTQYATKNADRIIAVSHETKRDLVERYGADEKKIVVIAPPIAPEFLIAETSNQKPDVKQKYKLPEKYILNVGSFFPRKNQKTLIEAFDLIKDKIEESLVLVGGAGNMLAEVKAFIELKGLTNRVKIVSGPGNEDMPAIYRNASVFVFPSLYEGFGMPIVEALLCGVPVIAANGGCFEEAGGKSSLYINPMSIAEVSKAIALVLADQQLRLRMTEAGIVHAQTMNPTVLAQKIWALYTSL